MIPHVRSFGKVALALRGGCATGSVDPEVCNAKGRRWARRA
jgi:hypothetical protein